MNSLMNYGSDGDNDTDSDDAKETVIKASFGAKKSNDAIYDPVPMDMSEDSNKSSDDSGSDRNARSHGSNSHKTDSSRNSTSTSDQRRTDNDERSSSSREKEHSSKHKSDDHKVDRHEKNSSKHSSDKRSDGRKRDHKDSKDSKRHRDDDRKSRDEDKRSRDSDKRKERSSKDDEKSERDHHRDDKKDRDKKDDKDRRRDRGRERDRDRARDKSRDKERSRDRSSGRDRSRDRERRHREDKSKHRDDRRSRDRDRRSRSRSRDKDRRTRSRSKSRDRVHRPFVPRDERCKNKLAQLEKLGIEIKTSDEILQNAQQEFYNPLTTATQGKYAEQIQKRKLLWQHKKQDDKAASTATASAANTWVGTTFTHDQDGKVTAKFKRLMGIKGDLPAAATPGDKKPDILKKQEEMFSNMEQQYEVARATTHTQRGVGLGYASGFSFPR